MADTLSAEIKVSCSWILKEALDLSTVVDSARLEYTRAVSDGAGADQASVVWHDQRAIAGGGNDDLDLAGGLSNTIFGTAVAAVFSRIKAIVIVNASIVAGDKLRVGGGSNPFTPPFAGSGTAQVEVGADSALVLSSKKDGWVVTAGSGDILRIHNPGPTAVTYRIVILGY
jgi:hypothetical protein